LADTGANIWAAATFAGLAVATGVGLVLKKILVRR
jgi:LPXTG-motif cell wall-anchored protein